MLKTFTWWKTYLLKYNLKIKKNMTTKIYLKIVFSPDEMVYAEDSIHPRKLDL